MKVPSPHSIELLIVYIEVMNMRKQGKIEEVKKVLEGYEEEDQHFRGIRCTLYHELAEEICQLFEKQK